MKSIASNSATMSASVTIIKSTPTATPVIVPHGTQHEHVFGDTYPELFALAVIIVGIIITLVVLIPLTIRGVYFLHGMIRGYIEGRRAALDEERAIELAAWSTSEAADAREAASLSGETLCAK